jgi:hypothetical protein
MNDSADLDPDSTGHDLTKAGVSPRLGMILASTAVFGVGAMLGAIWSGAALWQAFGAYMLGGWFGLAVAVLSILWRDHHA